MNANTLTQKLAARVAWVCFIFLLSSFSSLGVAQPVIAYPDLQVLTPTSQISIGNPTSSTREFRFSHITWNAGAGPLEIRPNYNPSTNQSQGYQRLYTRNASGGLTFVMDLPIAVPMYWMPPTDYRFAMSGFGLYSDVNGSLGTLVAASPKVNFCMTADVAVNLKLPFAPSSTAYSPGNCGDPNGILGLSIGWGDQYDYTDPGENIDITSLPDGIYWLRSIADPYHILQESDTSNNATDTQVQITGNTVKVLQQIQPNSTPPTVTLTSPVPGASVSGSVVLTATATPVTGSSIQGVQFLVDGQPVPGTVTSNPPQYSITWNANVVGSHLIAAQATSSSGFIGTAPPLFVTVATQVGALVMDQTVNATGVGTVTTQVFSTSAPNERLLAFVGSDGPAPSQSQSVTVSGGGLLWTLVQRGNVQSGDAEIWSATLASPVSNLTVTSTPTSSGYSQSLTVVALHGTGGIASIGAHSSAGAPHGAGAASVSLTTTAPGSWVLGVGSDYDNAIAPTLGANQQLINQQLFTAAGVTFWVQATTGITPSSNTVVTLNDTAPTGDAWNFSSVEVVAAGSQPPPQDTTPPIVNIATPSAGTVSGTVTVTANATDNVALRTSNPVVFSLNGSTPLPGQVTSNGSLFSTTWDTTTSANGTQVLSATATDTSNNTSTASISVTVSNPPPTTTCFIVDATTNVQGRGPVTTTAFSDALPGELLVAFAASDGPSGSQTLTVSGAGLNWKLVKRANAQSGTAEIWTATAPSSARLTNATVTAKQSKTGYDMSLYLIAVQGTGGIGASAAASASSGAPTVTLQTTKAGSLVYGVGNDYDGAVARTVGYNQILDNQWLDSVTGDTYWVQNQTYPPLIPVGASVTLNDTAPTKDRWNFVSIEIIADDN
jgi:Bacterial Ig domain/Lysyl oxidase